MLQIWPILLCALLKDGTFLLDQNAGKEYLFFYKAIFKETSIYSDASSHKMIFKKIFILK